MKLVVHTADYGMTDCITDGCLHAIRDGILMDVGLMTNNPCSARAVEEIKKYPHVSMGQEINLVAGTPASDPKKIPTLVNEDGRFLTSRERMVKHPGQKDMGLCYDDLFKETENQVLKFMEMVGKKPIYLGGHSINTPDINKAREDVCKKYGIEFNWQQYGIHTDHTRWYKDYARTKSGFTADIQASTDVEGYVVEDKGDLLSHEYSLLSTHCGFSDGDLMKVSTFHVIRGIECSMLCSEKVKRWVKENQIELMNVEQYLREKRG